MLHLPTNLKQPTPQSKRLYPAIKASEFAYRADFELLSKTEAAELRREAWRSRSTGSDGQRWKEISAKSLEDRLLGYRLCGLHTKYQECTACKGRALKTAHYTCGGNAKPCHLRNCTFCGRRGGNKKQENLYARYQDLPKRDDYRLKHITIQISWSPDSYEDTTVEAYRERAKLGWKAIQAGWKPERYLELDKEHPWIEHGLFQPGTALYARLEASQNGFVHFHLLYYGPYLRWYCDHCKAKGKEHCRCTREGRQPKKHFYLQDLMRAAYPKVGNLWIEEVEEGSEEKIVQEVCKYVSKGPSPLDEKAILGAKKTRLNPTLAARLELALYGLHTSEVYGGFRRPAQPKVTVEEIGALPSGIDGAIEGLFSGSFATHEEFLEWAESFTMGEVWQGLDEHQEADLVNAIREAWEARGAEARDQLAFFLGNLLHQIAEARRISTDCEHCGLLDGLTWKVCSTWEWIRYKQSLLKTHN